MDEDQVVTPEPTMEPEVQADNEPSLEDLIAQFKAQEESPEPQVEPEPVVEPETPEPTPVSEPEPVQVPNEEPEKKVQTPEENAKFAEMRRQQQMEQRIQEELNKRLAESPEMKAAKLLSEMYQVPPDQLYQKLEEARLQKEAQERNVPIELLKERQQFMNQTQQLQEQLNQMRFQNWQVRIEKEKAEVAGKYSMLTPEEIDDSIQFMLRDLKNPELPLENVIFARHGAKIADKLKEIARNEALAEISGRAKSPLAPQTTKPTPTIDLSEEERYVAKMMGLSEKDYLKYKEG